MEKAQSIFKEYMDRYNYLENDPLYEIKCIHPPRVAELCVEIGRELGLDETKSYIIGLLHDIGRFPQIAEHGTLLDHKSTDHGTLSYEILQEYYDDEDILGAVLHHNKYSVPTDNPYYHLIRDCDKIDILFQQSEKQYEYGEISKEVLKSYLKREMVHNEHRKTSMDNLLGYLALYHDIQFEPARKIANKYIAKIIENL